MSALKKGWLKEVSKDEEKGRRRTVWEGERYK